jgi:ATP-dependent helicase HrpB
MVSLPIDAHIDAILDALSAANCLVIEAAPGAGKTTRVPPALLRFGNVVVLEPRRLAARMAAARVAQELGERLGDTVGYQVRFEETASEKTRLRFITEGILPRKMLGDPALRSTGVVVLDEFHERHLDGDLALALVRRLQRNRPDLKLVVMSATMDSAAVAAHLGGCPAVRAEGRLFDLTVEYTPHSALALEEQVAAALERLVREGLDGDVLVFLPGAREIRASIRACERIAASAGLLALPLYGDLPPEEQDRAVRPAGARKVIFSTNVAESSLTIDGVTVVIDSGLARVASDSPFTGLPELAVRRISQASANQRAGRAGRTRPGRVIRLYPLDDFIRRPEHETPEILRRDLAGLCLDLRALRIGKDELPWFEPPPEASWNAASDLLERIGANETMARLPLHPRLAALVVEAQARGAGELGCCAAAVLSAGHRSSGSRDLLAATEDELDYNGRRTRDQLARFIRARRSEQDDEGLLKAALRAYPDRVRKQRDGSLILALDVEERSDRAEPVLRLYARIEAEWLLEMFPDRVEDRSGLEWNRVAERVEEVNALVYDGVVIDESRSAPRDPEAAGRFLAQRAWDAGVHKFADAEALAALRERVSFAHQHGLAHALDDGGVRAALDEYCIGRRGFADLDPEEFVPHLLFRIPAPQRRLLDELAPERIRLASGRQAKIRYEPGKPPVVASRLQDFFGMKETPRVAAGRVPLLIELLAPSQRPVQTTTDLAGFWERLYPQVRRELMRRYPRHSWPEDPLRTEITGSFFT